jgi:peroxiredoxin
MSPRKWIVGLVFVIVVLALTLMLVRRSKGEEYRRYSSPDGRFRVVVFRIPSAFAMPGGSSDAPGYIQLKDAKTGRVLREQEVELVQLVDHVEWSATNVCIRLLADWSLPE